MMDNKITSKIHNTTLISKMAAIVSASIFLSCALLPAAYAQVANQAVVEEALNKQWAPVSSATGGQKKSVTVHSVKLGKAAKAALSDVGIDGVPKGAMMTPALVDFTVREYYRTETLAVRRVREVKLYKDSFDEWRMLSGASRAPDVRTYEPAAK